MIPKKKNIGKSTFYFNPQFKPKTIFSSFPLNLITWLQQKQNNFTI